MFKISFPAGLEHLDRVFGDTNCYTFCTSEPNDFRPVGGRDPNLSFLCTGLLTIRSSIIPSFVSVCVCVYVCCFAVEFETSNFSISVSLYHSEFLSRMIRNVYG